MDLSITIASYNSKDVTRCALQSILCNTRQLSLEIIVVDNASSDGSADMIEQEFPTVRLIRSDKNLGFAAAHNLALRHAHGQYLLVLNSDVLFVGDVALEMVAQLSNASEKTGVLGPRILNLNGSYVPSSSYRQFYPLPIVVLSTINQYFPFSHLLPLHFVRRHFSFLLGRIHGRLALPGRFERVEWLDGMCVLFKREVLHHVGLFDEQFFFDSEIGDLLARIRQAGWDVVYAPSASVVHLGGYSRGHVPQIMVQSVRSRLTYFAKHKPEYVPCLRNTYLLLVAVRQLLAKSVGTLVRELSMSPTELEILADTRAMVESFDVCSVKKRQRIPLLPIDPHSVC